MRKVYPKEVISTILSGEQARPFSPPIPARLRPATLSGEGEKLKRQNKLQDRPMSQASTDAPRNESRESRLTARGTPSTRPGTSMSVRSGRMITAPGLREAGLRHLVCADSWMPAHVEQLRVSLG